MGRERARAGGRAVATLRAWLGLHWYDWRDEVVSRAYPEDLAVVLAGRRATVAPEDWGEAVAAG